jgi:hypothetical protein
MIATMLPELAVAHTKVLQRSQTKFGCLSEWLECLRPGWATRFTPAFERLGITDLQKVELLCGVDCDALEDELRKHGAKLVQVMEIRKSIQCLAQADKTPVAPAEPYRKNFESPMAAYFGDSTCFAIPQSNTSNNPVLLGRRVNKCKTSPPSTFFDEEFDQIAVYRESELPQSLPCKSPMSAFFDGDSDLDRFCMKPSQSSTSPMGCVPDMVTFVSCVGSCSGSPSIVSLPVEAESLSPPRALHRASVPHNCKSALHRGPKSNCNRVSFADGSEMAPIQLVELVNSPPATCAMPLAPHAAPFAQDVWLQSRDQHGTFAVQKAIDECRSDEERVVLANALRGHVMEAVHCRHANHVLKKIITSVPPQTLDFVILELLSNGKQAIVDVAKQRYGCRIMESLLTHCTAKQLGCVVQILLGDAAGLCTHMYGNFVMQQLLAQPNLDERRRLPQWICAHVALLGTSFYGSAVLRQALLCSSAAEKYMLSRAILSVHGLLSAMGRFRQGKDSIDLILTACCGSDDALVQVQLTAPPLKLARGTRERWNRF